MFRLIVFIGLTIWIFPSDCRKQSIVIQEPPLCVNYSYEIPLFSTEILRMTFNQTRLKQLNVRTIRVRASIADRKVAEFYNHRQSIKRVFRLINNTEQYNDESIVVYNSKIHAKYINRTYIHYSIEVIDTNNRVDHINCSVVLMISQPKRFRDKIFKISIPYVIMFISIQMGALLDTEVLKELALRPTQVLIGFTCQYGFMPLIAFAISNIFRYEPIYGLGLFVIGCCPGGTQSNQWTIVFDGDINLSAFMSFASTVASFFMMPFWLYTLGQYTYLRQLKIHIPYFHLATSLLTVIAPLGIGMILVYFIPKLKPIIKRIVKPMLFILIVYFFVFGAFVNSYLFHYVDLRTALTAPLLPWLGFLLGGFFAWICRQDWKRMLTIGIETGIQNIGIAMMILIHSFPAPANSQACVIPLIVAYLSSQPFYLVLIYQFIRRKCCKPKEPIHHKSLDTLERTTRQLSEPEIEPFNDKSQIRKISIPISVLGSSPDSAPVEI